MQDPSAAARVSGILPPRLEKPLCQRRVLRCSGWPKALVLLEGRHGHTLSSSRASAPSQIGLNPTTSWNNNLHLGSSKNHCREPSVRSLAKGPGCWKDTARASPERTLPSGTPSRQNPDSKNHRYERNA
ncbi:hypothetical protein AV530_003631 [Patagioenas fasciata monilis]|uniref:Uncharacterized protein n=1 Tax=Patagioenas fasciata monilis TaxID=372326 RepID=A0A1V4KYB2_PATFA|nr:hypothetical protein AV530_003631 [Patagioenas fasciata monilis]